MSDRLASASWEDQGQVTRRFPYDFRNIWLGRAEDQTPIGYADDRHICLISGSRGGKGTSIIVNNLCYWPGSAVVIDPKGENATVTAARRGRGDEHCAGLGQAVHVLDPFQSAQVQGRYRSSFNPLDALDPNNEESIDEANRLANAIVVVKDDRSDPFFEESARSMVRALILHVLTDEDFAPEERTLPMMRDLLKRGAWRIAEAMRDNGDEPNPPHQLLFRAMEMNPAFGGVVAGDGTRFLSMLANSPKTFESVLQTALVNTEFLESPGMRRVLETSSFKLSDLKADPRGMTLYLSLPQRYMDTHYRWLRMMVTLTMAQMEITRGRPATGRPVLMILDEFAGLKRMTAIENAVAQIAGFGVKLFFVLQSLEQLKYTYKDNWETFLSNAGLKIFFSVDDHFTREYVSKLMGETEITRFMHSENEGSSENESFADGTSNSSGRSQSYTQGSSQSRTSGTSETRGTGRNQSVNESRSSGQNWSRNRSTSDGVNEGQNWSQGSSSGVSYKENSGFLGLFRSIDQDSVSHSSSVNSSFGGSRGTSHTETDGTSRGGSNGTSRGSSHGTNESESRGRSESTTYGTSSSTTEGTSETYGTSQTHTRGSGRTSGSGRSETIHRRPLLRPEEFGKLFARIDDRNHPAYPGFVLVLINGVNPLVVKRTHYFEDPQFIDCFSPHPDHRFTAARSLPVKSMQTLIGFLKEEAAPGKPLQIGAWRVAEGSVVTSRDVLFRIANVPHDGRTIGVRAPGTGKAVKLASRAAGQSGTGKSWPPIDAAVLCEIKYYPGQEGETIDALAELREACRLLDSAPEQRPLPPPNQTTGSSIPRVVAGCFALSAAIFSLQLWAATTIYRLFMPTPFILQPVPLALGYFGGIWGGMILGIVKLKRIVHGPGAQRPKAGLLLGSCLMLEAAFILYANGQRPGLVFSYLFAPVILLPPVVLSLFWLWFRRAAPVGMNRQPRPAVVRRLSLPRPLRIVASCLAGAVLIILLMALMFRIMAKFD